MQFFYSFIVIYTHKVDFCIVKKLSITVLSFLFWLNAFPQSSSDCVGALPFCSATGEGEATVSPGDGDVLNETALACVDNEGYSTWYTFTPTSDGIFNFVLTPVNENDDYDWALFDITNHSCEDVPTDPSLLVSCNSWGAFGVNGPTGISSDSGGVGNQNGPGTTNGPPFNGDLNVFEGNTYVLMVSNWSESTEGFNIDVSGSTATGIYANNSITNFSSNEICLGENSELDITFNGDPLGPITYQWYPPELFNNATVEDPVFTNPLTQSTEITVIINNGPCVYTRTREISVASIEYNKENLFQNLCVGEQLNLEIEFSGVESAKGLEFSWSPTNLLDNANSEIPKTVQLFDTTTFYFDLINGPCMTSDSITVYIHNDTVKADFDFELDDNLSTIPIEANFFKNSIGDSTWLWDFDDNTTSTEENPYQHEFPGYDKYDVMLIAISPSTFCVDTVIKTIQYPEVEYPNIITPNNDGINDVLWIRGLIIGTSLRVYNRWGKLIFKAENYLHDWKGESLNDGIYFVEYINPEGEAKKGWIQVLR